MGLLYERKVNIMNANQIKYTSDGKKVVVIGSLNSQEKIVQEIFVVGDSEIPSGEHFTVKSLHDQPAISWKEKELKAIDETYASTYETKKAELKKLNSEYDVKVAIAKAKLECLKNLELNLSEESLQRLIDFVSGGLRWIVEVSRYKSLAIYDLDSYIAKVEKDSYRGKTFDSLKLLSVFGRSKGDLIYKANHWSDGSGNYGEIMPFNTKEEAIEYIKVIFYQRLEKGLTSNLLETAKEYNFEISPEKLKEYNDKQKSQVLENIQKKKSEMEKLELELKQFKRR